MSGQTIRLDWKPPGRVAAAFMNSTADVQIINGPVGSGKTTAVQMKSTKLAALQRPSPRDGVRRFKLTIVATTYRQIWRALLPSWWKRMPREIGDFTGAENAPAVHRIPMELGDGSRCEFHTDFLAIGDNAVEDVLRGYEPTAFWLYEMDLLQREVFLYAKGRAGRYPDSSDGGPSWYGIFGDCNAPKLSNWLYQDVFRVSPGKRKEDGVELFVQPGGFDRDAENLDNLPGGREYYVKQAKGQPQWYIDAMINNRSGYSRAGKPVYSEFSDHLHIAPAALEAIPGIPLQIGLDAGGSPAAVFCQRMANGQWRILRELIGEKGTGARRFADDLSKMLGDHFSEVRDIVAYADPSAAYGADKEAGEKSWIEIVAERAKIVVEAAPTNALLPRLEAVRKPLSTLIDGEPALLASPECVMLREGFNSGYRFKKMTGGDEERFTEEPDKFTPHSHVHDALQYVLSGGGEDMEIRGRSQSQEQDFNTRVRDVQTDWNPLGA